MGGGGKSAPSYPTPQTSPEQLKLEQEQKERDALMSKKNAAQAAQDDRKRRAIDQTGRESTILGGSDQNKKNLLGL